MRSQLQNKKTAWRRMVQSPAFGLWLRLETGRVAAAEAQLVIPAAEIRTEVRVGGRWVEVPAGEPLRD